MQDMKLNEIHLRDPFILPVQSERRYYLYGTNGPNPWDNPLGFDAYVSEDLETWEGPISVFRPPHDFWADRSFWAPEVVFHQGRYYMTASFTLTHWSHRRGTQILVSDSPSGPFVPHSNGPVTPEGDVSIDGTLFWDENEQPWMIYCHERMQVTDGLMCAIPLSADLTQSIGAKHDLFRASTATWAHVIDENQYTTDGPFLFKAPDGQLLMLWSSFHNGIYAQGLSRSRSGKVLGPWTHDPTPIFGQDGGHGMVFQDWDDNLILVLHAPGMTYGEERAVLFALNFHNDEVTLTPWKNNVSAMAGSTARG